MMHLTGEKSEIQSCIDHGKRPKSIRLDWKSPSNNFQDVRKSWRDAQDTEKEE